jgi:hypothetical protein
MTTARVGSRPVLIVNSTDRMSAGFMRTALGDLAFRDELASGTLMTIPVLDSPNIPAHRAIMVDAAYFGFGLDTPRFDMSSDATLVMLNADDTTPTMAGAQATGAIGTNDPGTVIETAGPMVSDAVGASAEAINLFQTYSRALRMVQFGGWAPTTAGTVQYVDNTTWSVTP